MVITVIRGFMRFHVRHNDIANPRRNGVGLSGVFAFA
jgi:hypothetical protein